MSYLFSPPRRVFGEFVGCEPERESEGQLEDVLADFAMCSREIAAEFAT